MLASVAIAPLNHLLQGESWARRRLQACAGKTARFRLPPFVDLALTVQAGGEVSAAASDSPCDAIFTLHPTLLLRLLANNAEAYREIRISGDSAFADEILQIGKNLRWDAEEDLSRIMGDVLAHRLVRTGDNLVQWQKGVLDNLLQTMTEYWTEEQPVLAKPADMRELTREVNRLSEDTQHLEERLNALHRKMAVQTS
ncbi:MAG TPA: SCP2 sterol-binding domain-containing protein [Nitrosospira sp.]|nr:SCP2 sterol-binding domain-containing protein [Nitrosospira sp.]